MRFAPKQRPANARKWYGTERITVAGTHHRLNNAIKFANRAIARDRHGRDTKMILARHSRNRFDSNAIAVFGGGFSETPGLFRFLQPGSGHIHLGYIPADIAEDLAPRMDAGERFVVGLWSIFQRDDGHVVIDIGVFEAE